LIADSTQAGAVKVVTRMHKRPRLLRQTASPRLRLQRRPPPARQPPGRRPARLPQDRHSLRRSNRLGSPVPNPCCLTF